MMLLAQNQKGTPIISHGTRNREIFKKKKQARQD